MTLPKPPQEVIRQYFGEGVDVHLEPIEVGHIHGSWVAGSRECSLFIQRINNYVFEDIETLDRNIICVLSCLKSSSHGQQYDTLTLQPTLDGKSMIEIHGAYWRAFIYQQERKSWSQPQNHAMVSEAGRAFASFVQGLSSLEPGDLGWTIKDFHSLQKRIEALKVAQSRPMVEVTPAIERLIDQALELSAEVSILEDAASKGSLLTRVVHNDAKLNNLLFDDDDNARCVVDLDTVMPGIIHFDVGDALRTITPSHDEESGYHSMTLNLEYYSCFKTAYTDGNWLTKVELELFDLAAPYMATIMGVRFLTDYLQGDVYFKTSHSDQNLKRANNQLHLATLFLEIPLP
ncbi:MAG: aminoglycoside phosphotransferase family protein [Balneolaceae bacterium]|nr:aminoglycoside phosphotransferase family protein [Balneolaceae bacterium]